MRRVLRRVYAFLDLGAILSSKTTPSENRNDIALLSAMGANSTFKNMLPMGIGCNINFLCKEATPILEVIKIVEGHLVRFRYHCAVDLL